VIKRTVDGVPIVGISIKSKFSEDAEFEAILDLSEKDLKILVEGQQKLRKGEDVSEHFKRNYKFMRERAEAMGFYFLVAWLRWLHDPNFDKEGEA